MGAVMVQAERILQTEVMLKMRTQYPELIVAVIPNGTWFGGVDRERVKFTLHKMKQSGMLTPGAADLVVAGQGRAAFIELKVPRSRDLLGKVRAQGTLNPDQRAFRDRCEACGVPYFVARSWEDVESAIAVVWGYYQERIWYAGGTGREDHATD